MNTALDAQIAKQKAEVASAAQRTATKEDATAQQPHSPTSWWSTYDAMTISASVLIFGVVLIAFAARAVRLGTQPGVVLRLFGMLTIIIMAVFLVVAGYDAQQISPVTGLLGTLAGYLAGRSSTASAMTGDPPAPKKSEEKIAAVTVPPA